MSLQWAAAVAATGPALVQPPGERRAQRVPPGPLRALDVLPLDEQRALAVVEDGAGGRWTVPLRAEGGGVRRAVAGDGVAEAVVRVLGAAGSASSAGFATTAWHCEPVEGERAVTVDQTNESIVVGERAVVKWSVSLPPEHQPGSSAARRITALLRGGFDEMPRPWGTVELVGVDGDAPVLVATVVEYLPGAQDGWDWAVDDVRRYARGELAPEDAGRPAEVMGGLTARMHVALAGDGRTSATSSDASTWRERALTELAAARDIVDGPPGLRLRGWYPRIASAYDALAAAEGTVLVACHGDLHVGQVLRVGDRYAVTDFDGNPVLDPLERIAARPVAADVAGMLASLDHVGRIVLHRTPDVDGEAVRTWIGSSQVRFLTAYRAGLRRHAATDLFDERLLHPLRFAQEVREYLYAARHLPHWVYAPDLALADLLDDPVDAAGPHDEPEA